MSHRPLRQWLRSLDGREACLFAAQAFVLWHISRWPS